MNGNGSPIYLTEEQIKPFLNWPLMYNAVEQALRSVSQQNYTVGNDSITNNNWMMKSCQPPRTITKNTNGTLFTMPSSIENYNLNINNSQLQSSKSYQISKDHTMDNEQSSVLLNTLACKLVTGFSDNEKRKINLPNVLATILLFDTETGKLKAILEGTEITAWRTAAASLVATKYLYFNRCYPDAGSDKDEKINQTLTVAIVGCGVQGRIHSIGILQMFHINELYLWNRTESKANALQMELTNLKGDFLNKNCKISIAANVKECVTAADIIIISTQSAQPLITYDMIKNHSVHINAVGLSESGLHHAEVDETIYKNAQIYTDSLTSAKIELATLNFPIVGEIGEIINGLKSIPSKESITIFQSLGMALEDATSAQAIYECYKKNSTK